MYVLRSLYVYINKIYNSITSIVQVAVTYVYIIVCG